MGNNPVPLRVIMVSLIGLKLNPGKSFPNLKSEISNLKSQISNPMATWQCVKQCGACCHLDPQERPDLEEYLSPEELELYFSLVGEGGWCIHFDRSNRSCGIYSTRPRFCRVEPETFRDMYGIEPEEVNDFAIDCCHQHIESTYGPRSIEMVRFNSEVYGASGR